jgi:hypothetical protein
MLRCDSPFSAYAFGPRTACDRPDDTDGSHERRVPSKGVDQGPAYVSKHSGELEGWMVQGKHHIVIC